MASSHRGAPTGPIAEWTIREQLILASAVQRSGDQNWVSVSRAIKPLVEDARPADYFSQKNCALQYSAMLDKTGTRKRKRSNEGGSEVVETAEQQIVRQLAEKRIIELNKSLANMKEEHSTLSKEIKLLENGDLDSKLPKLWEEIQVKISSTQTTGILEASKDTSAPQSVIPENLELKKQISPVQHTPLAKFNSLPSVSKEQLEQQSVMGSIEVDTKNLHAEIQTVAEVVPAVQKSETDSTITPSLTTGIDLKPSQSINTTLTEVKSPTLKTVTTCKEDAICSRPMHTPHPSTQSTLQQLSSDVHLIIQQPNTAITRSSKEDTEKPSAGAVTSLPIDVSTSQESVVASLCYNDKSSTSTTGVTTIATVEVAPSIAPKNIVSSALYVANPAVSAAVLSSPQRTFADQTLKLDQTRTSMPMSEPLKSTASAVITSSPVNVSTSVTPSTLSSLSRVTLDPQPKANVEVAILPKPKNPTQVLAHPVVKPVVPHVKAVVSPKNESYQARDKMSIENSTPAPESGDTKPLQVASPVETQHQKVADTAVCENNGSTVPLQQVEDPAPSSEMKQIGKPDAVVLRDKTLLVQSDTSKSDSDSTVVEKTVTPSVLPTGNELETASQATLEDVSATSGDMDVLPVIHETPPKETLAATTLGPKQVLLQVATSPIAEPTSQSHESKIREEVVVEEVKSQKRSERVLRKHVSRKRKLIDDEGPSVESTDTEEEPISTRTSAAPSPAPSQSDMDPDAVQARKQWKKAIMLVWRHAAQHKYANLFLHPVREEDAPGYRDVILRPMDLYTIKRKVEAGVIKTDTEFQRDMLLMFQNAFMYNNSDHDVFFMAQEMKNDVMESIQDYLATQAQLQLMENHHTPQQKTLRSREGRTREFHDESIFSPVKKRKTRADD